LALGEGNLTQARILAEEVPSGVPDRATQGERLGMCAIVFAAVAEADRAHDAAMQARAITGAVEARCYSLFAEAIAALQGGEPNGALRAEVARALRECHQAEYLDAFVLAYRAFPPVMTFAAGENDLSGLIQGVIKRARDQRLASRLGFRMATPPSRSTKTLLTPREGEVLTLIGQGLSNAEIATRLVITESTAKVHVHNILAKLRVKTRLQAALIAQQDLDETH
jgi:DNA-binding NarL/FixJ family response regulator